MKKRLLVSFILISMLFCLLGCKSLDVEQSASNDIITMDESFFMDSESTPDEKNQLPMIEITAGSGGGKASVTLADRTVKSLMFDKAEEAADQSTHRTYLDESKNRFKFTESGALIAYYQNGNVEPTMATASFTAESADVIARKHIEDTYGDLLNGFHLKQTWDNGSYYAITYVKGYGAEQLVNGELCFVDVNYDGTIRSSNVMHFEKFAEFDTSLLNGISKEALQSYVEQKAKSEKPEYYTECIIKDIYLERNDSSFYLSIHTEVLCSESQGADVVSGTLEVYDYPLCTSTPSLN